MAKIYKITNIINQKIYIGCTIKSIDERFQEHKSRSKIAKYKSKLYNSINKYGIENFTIELVIECEDCEMFNLEIKYIKEWDTFNSGLNNTLGGEGCLGYTHDEETKELCINQLNEIAESRKGKTYKEIYGDSAEEEITKRSIASKKAWENLSKNDKLTRSKAIQQNALDKSGYTKELILEIRKFHSEGIKPRFLLDRYPQLTSKDIKNILDKRKWNNL